MEFESQLDEVLPADVPGRESVIRKAAQHLALIQDVNQYLNLTRIATPRDAVIKHVLDSVLPWRLFAASRHVLDAGTGAGFPGIPLALALPETRFTLAESIGKKARFVESALTTLALPNVTAVSRRAEEFCRDQSIDTITARAVAPLGRVLALFAPALKAGKRILLYKGPDVEREIAESAKDAARLRARVEVVMRYDLPEGLGTRTIVRIES